MYCYLFLFFITFAGSLAGMDQGQADQSWAIIDVPSGLMHCPDGTFLLTRLDFSYPQQMQPYYPAYNYNPVYSGYPGYADGFGYQYGHASYGTQYYQNGSEYQPNYVQNQNFQQPVPVVNRATKQGHAQKITKIKPFKWQPGMIDWGTLSPEIGIHRTPIKPIEQSIVKEFSAQPVVPVVDHAITQGTVQIVAADKPFTWDSTRVIKSIRSSKSIGVHQKSIKPAEQSIVQESLPQHREPLINAAPDQSLDTLLNNLFNTDMTADEEIKYEKELTEKFGRNKKQLTKIKLFFQAREKLKDQIINNIPQESDTKQAAALPAYLPVVVDSVQNQDDGLQAVDSEPVATKKKQKNKQLVKKKDSVDWLKLAIDLYDSKVDKRSLNKESLARRIAQEAKIIDGLNELIASDDLSNNEKLTIKNFLAKFYDPMEPQKFVSIKPNGQKALAAYDAAHQAGNSSEDLIKKALFLAHVENDKDKVAYYLPKYQSLVQAREKDESNDKSNESPGIIFIDFVNELSKNHVEDIDFKNASENGYCFLISDLEINSYMRKFFSNKMKNFSEKKMKAFFDYALKKHDWDDEGKEALSGIFTLAFLSHQCEKLDDFKISWQMELGGENKAMLPIDIMRYLLQKFEYTPAAYYFATETNNTFSDLLNIHFIKRVFDSDIPGKEMKKKMESCLEKYIESFSYEAFMVNAHKAKDEGRLKSFIRENKGKIAHLQLDFTAARFLADDTENELKLYDAIADDRLKESIEILKLYAQLNQLQLTRFKIDKKIVKQSVDRATEILGKLSHDDNNINLIQACNAILAWHYKLNYNDSAFNSYFDQLKDDDLKKYLTIVLKKDDLTYENFVAIVDELVNSTSKYALHAQAFAAVRSIQFSKLEESKKYCDKIKADQSRYFDSFVQNTLENLRVCHDQNYQGKIIACFSEIINAINPIFDGVRNKQYKAAADGLDQLFKDNDQVFLAIMVSPSDAHRKYIAAKRGLYMAQQLKLVDEQEAKKIDALLRDLKTKELESFDGLDADRINDILEQRKIVDQLFADASATTSNPDESIRLLKLATQEAVRLPGLLNVDFTRSYLSQSLLSK